MWWNKNKRKMIVPALATAILAAAFWYGGNAPGLQGWIIVRNFPSPVDMPQAPSAASPPRAPVPSASAKLPQSSPSAPLETTPPPPPSLEPLPSRVPKPSETPSSPPSAGLESRPGGLEGGMTAEEKLAAAAALAGGSSPGVQAGDRAYSEAQGMELDPSTGKDKYLTDPVPEGKPLPVEPQDTDISDTAYTCTLSISCASLLDHMDWLEPEKVELVPEDGWILPPTKVTFYEGESVFNVLWRTCKQEKIHMEFSNTPMYNSAYIEGIQNLYEFDCGELSGWMYKVNGWFPNYGCSRYQLQENDEVCWVYTCDLGVDVGGYYSTGK